MKPRTSAKLLLLPLILFIIIMTAFPLAYLYAISFTEYYLQLGFTPRFIGLENYLNIFKDPEAFNAILVTLKIIIPALLLEFTLGFAIALSLLRISKGEKIFCTIISIPLLVAPAIAALAFKLLYSTEYGFINYFISTLLQSDIRIDWLGSLDIAPYSCVIVDVWQMTPFVALVLYAGLLSIPVEIYEAAQIDGASGIYLFRYVTLPLMTPYITVVLILRLIELLKFFDPVFVLTMGGPAGATETIAFYIYFVSLKFFNQGYGSALAVMLTLFISFLSLAFLKIMQKVGG